MTDRPLQLSRRALIGGIASSGGLLLSGCSDQQPPTYGNILRMGDNLTYNAQRLLLSRSALVTEYDRLQISSMPAIGTIDPARPDVGLHDPKGGEAYAALRHGDFADWRLKVEGSVNNPRSFSLAELKKMQSRTQITRHTCEQGWTAIAEWTGVPLRSVLAAVGVRPSARFVQFYTFDLMADGIDMVDALHPQTILAYGMNGRELPIGHGAPLRLRIERQMGFKSLKFLRRIVVTDKFDDLGRAGTIQNGWSWYNGI
ncbi:molybdopterin-dependent oxidoreductase [Sphingobium sp. LMC3-1-1.1]|uniref:molybdopterin-dependent oxidoreductase n=1 Tax=unclassified Sphingobium TaxID=2611147 RepID=UPI00342C206A